MPFPLEPFALAWRHRALIAKLSKREILSRHQGSLLGSAWTILTPLLMLGVYTFVFTTVLPGRWPVPNDDHGSFALLLFTGLILFGFFAECVNRAPTLMLSNASYVKKVVFPIDVLPWIVIGAAAFNAIVSFVVLFAAMLLIMGPPPATAALLPLVVLPLIGIVAGLMWFLASLGVYFRDVHQVVALLVTATMFLSPVFYPAEALPENLRQIMLLNPLAQVLEQARGALFLGLVPSAKVWLAELAFGWALAWAGYTWFQRTRTGFADVL